MPTIATYINVKGTLFWSSFSVGKVDLKLKDENADLGTYVLNGEWHLLGMRNKKYFGSFVSAARLPIL